MVRLAMCVMVAACFFAGSANASNCSLDEYNHNGSVMEIIVCDGGGLNISYVTPRRGIAKQGVKSGTLLFNGVEQGNGYISGTARLFSSRCGVSTYQVAGQRNPNGNIVLSGQAPKRNNNCQVVGYRNDQLVFNLMGGVVAPPPPPVPGGGQGAGAPVPSCAQGYFYYPSTGNCHFGDGTPAPVAPVCPAGYFVSGATCQLASGGGGAGGTAGGSWHAIAGSFPSRSEALSRRRALGGDWYVMNTRDCPNFRNGYWIVTAGPFSKQEAMLWAGDAANFGANVKSCY